MSKVVRWDRAFFERERVMYERDVRFHVHKQVSLQTGSVHSACEKVQICSVRAAHLSPIAQNTPQTETDSIFSDGTLYDEDSGRLCRY